jgi:hypothetical protein
LANFEPGTIERRVDQMIGRALGVDLRQLEVIRVVDLVLDRAVRLALDQERLTEPVAIELMQRVGIDAQDRPEQEQRAAAIANERNAPRQ